MHSAQTRALLERCLLILAEADVSEEMKHLARNLLDHLIEMHDAGRMRHSVLLLALDSLELVPELGECVDELRAVVNRDVPPQAGERSG